MAIWYHGTIEENVAGILAQGFRKGTFFGQHLEDALVMGGPVVFEVWFEENPTEYWEFVAPAIPPERICRLYTLNPWLRLENKELVLATRKQFGLEVWGPEAVMCSLCAGRGQEEDWPQFTYWRTASPCTSCLACGGHGWLWPGEHALLLSTSTCLEGKNARN